MCEVPPGSFAFLNSTNPVPRVAPNPLPVMVKIVLVPATTEVGLNDVIVGTVNKPGNFGFGFDWMGPG